MFVGYLTKEFSNLDLNQYLAPNYAWQLEQGENALNNQLNSTGGLVSGNTLKAIQDYSLNFAGNSYQNAFNNSSNYTYTSSNNLFNAKQDKLNTSTILYGIGTNITLLDFNNINNSSNITSNITSNVINNFL